MSKLIETIEDFAKFRNEKRLEDFIIKNIEITYWIPDRQHFVDVRFENCKFIGGENTFLGSICKNVSFLECELDGVLFNGAGLNNSRFANSTLKKCQFERVMWSGVKFYNNTIEDCDFSGQMMIGCGFEYGTFKRNNIEGLKHRETGPFFENVDYSANYGTMKKI